MTDRPLLTPEERARIVAEGEECRRELARRIAPMKTGPFGPPTDLCLHQHCQHQEHDVTMDDADLAIDSLQAAIDRARAERDEFRRQLDERGTYEDGWRAAIGAAARLAQSYEPQCESCPRGVGSAILGLLPDAEHEIGTRPTREEFEASLTARRTSAWKPRSPP